MVITQLSVDLSIFSTAFDISFSSSTYYSQVSTLEDPIGNVIVKTELVYNKSLGVIFNTRDYSLYRSDSRYFNIDKNGTVTLKAALPYQRVYKFQISLLYTVTTSEMNGTMSGFLTSNVQVQVTGKIENSVYAILVMFKCSCCFVRSCLLRQHHVQNSCPHKYPSL